MINLIIFDLDGVLIEAKKIHYETLNKSLQSIDEKYFINWDDHLRIFDGLKTNEKLEILTKQKGLPKDSYKTVWDKKQRLTLEALAKITESKKLKDILFKLI